MNTQGQTEAPDDLEIAELLEAPIEISAKVAALEARTATLESSVSASNKLIMALETRIDRLEEAD